MENNFYANEPKPVPALDVRGPAAAPKVAPMGDHVKINQLPSTTQVEDDKGKKLVLHSFLLSDAPI